jgi:hypothetical protein
MKGVLHVGGKVKVGNTGGMGETEEVTRIDCCLSTTCVNINEELIEVWLGS